MTVPLAVRAHRDRHCAIRSLWMLALEVHDNAEAPM
jgi:hypothetical protein